MQAPNAEISEPPMLLQQLAVPDRTGRAIRVVISDDHPVVRRGLRQVFDAEGDIEVLGEAADAETAWRYVHAHHPDVLVIDLNMPGEPTLEVIPRLRERFPDTQIVVVTMQDEPAYARLALSLGVLGYVLKDAADAELVRAVRAVADGESFLNPRLGARVAIEPPSASRSASSAGTNWSSTRSTAA
jgi:two-component system response regulator NreC